MKREADRYARREPCGNCPFLKSAPLAHWAPQEYLKLADIEAREHGFGSVSFACHKDRLLPDDTRVACVGWLLDQRRSGVRSIALRLRLSSEPGLMKQFDEATGDERCYDSVTALVRANLAANGKRQRAMRA